MIFITGDLHGERKRLADFCRRMDLTAEDIIIVLGELGINFGNVTRNRLTRSEFDFTVPCTLFCVHGNHEQRPDPAEGYEMRTWMGGTVLIHPDYPRQIFAVDGEMYQIPTNQGIRKVFVMGGAYSVDKELRLRNGWPWFPDEQPSEEIKQHGRDTLDRYGWRADIVLSHTCPESMTPFEWFLRGIDQSRVDHSTENYLEELRQHLDFDLWYCAHFHGEKKEGKFIFLYRSIDLFPPERVRSE